MSAAITTSIDNSALVARFGRSAEECAEMHPRRVPFVANVPAGFMAFLRGVQTAATDREFMALVMAPPAYEATEESARAARREAYCDGRRTPKRRMTRAEQRIADARAFGLVRS